MKENNITYHIRGIYSTCELEPESTTQKIRVVRQEGNRKVTRQIDFYNLDMIISVGYRVNSTNATKFRRWATSVLKEYLQNGYAINQQITHLESRITTRLDSAKALAEELLNISVVANFATTASDGKTYNVEYYNLDMILSVGYRVKSRQGVLFRQWANSIVRFISCYPNNFFIISVLPKLFKSRIISCLYSFLYQKKNFR